MSIYSIIGRREVTETGLPRFSEQKAYEIIHRLAYSRAYFTTDDIWARMEKPAEPRRLGPLLIRAKLDGVIEPTQITQTSKQDTNHGRPVRVWKSLRYRTA